MKTIFVFDERKAERKDGSRLLTKRTDPYTGEDRRFCKCLICCGALIVMVVNVIPKATPEGRDEAGKMTIYKASQLPVQNLLDISRYVFEI